LPDAPAPPARQLLFICSQNRWRSLTADRLRAKFGPELQGKRIVNLRIPDDYPFEDPALVALLHERLHAYFGQPLAAIR
jgi:predicted protein tyrosine phosphatase